MFNDLRPMLPFVVQQVGSLVQIKPFAGYYIWLDWFDLSPLDQSADIAAILVSIGELETAVVTAYETATDAADLALAAADTAVEALNDAADAQTAADAAQADADAALAAAGGAVAPTFGVMMDEAVWNVTPTRLVSATYPYNYGVFTTAPAAATKKFTAQSGTWNIHILTYKGSNAGQLTIDIDGTTILTNLELYVASPAFTAYNHNLTSITITGSGWHTLQISCSSKHGSSSAHGLLVFKVWGERTGP